LTLGFVFSFAWYMSKQRNRIVDIQKLVDIQTEKLKLSNEEMSRFFFGMAHDLRHFATTIIGPLEMLRNASQNNTDSVSQMIGIMEHNSNRILGLTEQLMEGFKLTSNKIEVNLTPTDLVSQTCIAADYAASTIGRNQFPIVVGKPNEPTGNSAILVHLDHAVWDRIVINLITNAATHGYSELGLRIHFVIKANYVEVIFRDFGEGILDEHTNQLFDYMTKGTQSVGSGLGLYIVRGLVETLNGKITAQKMPDDGSSFVVTLPLLTEQEKKRLQKQPALSINNGSLPSDTVNNQPQPRLLLVDDEPEIIRSLSATLSSFFQIYTACNGKKALEIIGEIEPELVISDMVMPVMSGREFVLKLRKIEKYSTIPVVFLSGKSEAIDIAVGLNSGADIYLPKTVEHELLVSQLLAVYRREKRLQNEHGYDSKNTNDPEIVALVKALVYRHLNNPNLSPDLIAEVLHKSRSALYREWKKTGLITLNNFIMDIRLREAYVLISKEGYTISRASFAVGIQDTGYFSTIFKRHFGYRPSEIKKYQFGSKFPAQAL
jgi:DNA-binding response OmpR family regulator